MGLTLSALVSTGSAINATLFSAGYFARGLVQNDLLPDRVGASSESGAPKRMLVILGVVTAAFAASGSLGAITSFASLAFIVVFGGASYLAFRERGRDAVHPVPPALGVVGTSAFFPLLLYHLYRAEPQTLTAVVGIGVAVVAVELLYFERDVIESEVATIEHRLQDGEHPLDD
ncbi:APC family permease [Haloarcula regularis]|uniref:hypothetical protein n=1 Tax=Haloarcula regularis TaxID=3033392 RepID=UPI0023E795B6|nr:hypothetical protein [Halomicroarcula sp. SYNS111]